MQWKKLITAFLGFIGIICNGQELKIVYEGKSDYSICISEKSLPAIKTAADDLQLYISKSTGVKLPLLKSDNPGNNNSIIVGKHPAATAAGIDMTKIPQEGFIVKTVGKNLFITGYDTEGDPFSNHWKSSPQTGTWHGVCDFLEKEIGVRWFYPGEKGEYVPKKRDLVISELDYGDGPQMIYRRMSYLENPKMTPDEIKEMNVWLRHNRGGRSLIWLGSHSWVYTFPGEKYFDKHPEWFALVNGRRLGFASLGLQMCTTNAEALDEFANTIIRERKDMPGIMYSLSPNDGVNQCECEKCQALDNGIRPDGSRIMTDRYLTYCNEIAKRVNKVLPDQVFGFYAYGFYAEPPSKVKPDPHVFIMNVHNNIGTGYYVEKIRREHLEKELIPWKELTDSFLVYSTPEGMGNLNLPSYARKSLKYFFENMKAAGVKGLDMNNFSSFGSTGLNNYLSLKMCWHMGNDIDKLYADAIADCYGRKAAPFIRKYFDEVEIRIEKFSTSGPERLNRAMGFSQMYPDILDTVYVGLYEQSMPWLKQAESLVSDEGQAARVRMLIDELEYARLTVDIYMASKKMDLVKPSSADVMNAMKISEARNNIMEVMKKTPDNFYIGSVTRCEKEYRLPFQHDKLKYLADFSEKKSAMIPFTDSAPAMKGKVDDGVWKNLPEISIVLDKDTAKQATVKTTAKLAYDNAFLYVGIHCNEPEARKIKDSVTKHDGEIWTENEIELFIDSENSAKNFKQILVNSLGTVCDIECIYGKSNMEWSSDAKAVTYKGDDFWSMTLAIPLKKLTDKKDICGTIWGFNICRVRNTATPPEYICWSPTFGGFGKPERFGKIIFH